MKSLSTLSVSMLSILLLLGCEPRQPEPVQPEATDRSTPQMKGSKDQNAKGQNTGGQGNPHNAPQVKRAVAVLTPIAGSGVSGVIHFNQSGEVIQVTGEVRGLTPGEHGFHVHEYGDLTDQQAGNSAGDHYNPTEMPHGRPEDQRRHVGDLGNITANEQGVATINIEDSGLRLSGPHSIIGRGLVVHANPDQFVQPSGDAGDRIAVGVIGIAQPQQPQ